MNQKRLSPALPAWLIITGVWAQESISFFTKAGISYQDQRSLAGLTGQRVGAGSVFTGIFELDLSNPVNSAKFGIQFAAKPSGFSPI